MDNNQNKDDIRFNKLYELLGDEVNSIYETKNDNEIFTDNNNVNQQDNSNELQVSPSSNISDNVQSIHANSVRDVLKVEPVSISNSVRQDENMVNEPEINRNVYLNKTTVEGKNIVDDIDNLDDVKKTLRDILSNHKIVSIILILAFLCVCIVVGKAFYFGNKVQKYEKYFTEITYKEEEMAKVYEDGKIDNEIMKKMAASELINCISSPIDMDHLPESIQNVIDDINNYYNSSYNYFSFAYKDIFTGFTVSYNANQNIFTASAIKGPTDIYIYEMASMGKVNLDEVVTYTGNYYNTGSGVLKNKPINSKYSIRTLLEYSTVTSDNAAHNMLMDKYGRENMLKFWSNLGTNAIFTANNNWGVMNAHDALIYMNELYSFYARDNEYGEAIMNNFIKAYPTFLKGKNDVIVANKSGWSGTAIHDVAIIFTDNPYIVVALSNTGESDYVSYFNNANDLAYRLHEEYWKYKMSTCNSIKQY